MMLGVAGCCWVLWKYTLHGSLTLKKNGQAYFEMCVCVALPDDDVPHACFCILLFCLLPKKNMLPLASYGLSFFDCRFHIRAKDMRLPKKDITFTRR